MAIFLGSLINDPVSSRYAFLKLRTISSEKIREISVSITKTIVTLVGEKNSDPKVFLKGTMKQS